MTQTNNNQATQLFNISKSYEGRPSKNNAKYERDLTWEESIGSLDAHEKSWKTNGGIIVSRTESELVVLEPDDSETITFSITEA